MFAENAKREIEEQMVRWGVSSREDGGPAPDHSGPWVRVMVRVESCKLKVKGLRAAPGTRAAASILLHY